MACACGPEGVAVAKAIVAAAPDMYGEIARLCREKEALVERVRVCSGALTPVSENEKRGMERVLAILDRKIAEGGAVVSSDAAAVERHNAYYRARWSAFSECAMMLRSATEGERHLEPDEPMFVLLGRDRHAPTLVRLWANISRRSGKSQQVTDEALQCAFAMEAWQRRLGKKELKIPGPAVLNLIKAVGAIVAGDKSEDEKKGEPEHQWLREQRALLGNTETKG
jgi:hypothetical protein